MKRCGFVILVLALSIPLALAQTKALTNGDVIQMCKAGFDEQTIVNAIHANPTAFDTSVEALLSLKKDGVGKTVIDAMLEEQAKKTAVESGHNSTTTEQTVSPGLTARPTSGGTLQQKAINPAVYVEEVSSQGGVVASSDSALEAIKTLQEKHIRVVTIKEKADFILQVTRQLGKKSWRKDTKIALSNREGEVVLARSTRTVGGAMGDVVDYVQKLSK